MKGVHIAVDITAAADTAITAMAIVPMGIMAIAIARMATTVAIGDTDTTVAIGDTDIMVAIGPIAGTGGAVHIVAGVDYRPFKRATLSS